MQDNWNRFILQFRLHRQMERLMAGVTYDGQSRLKTTPIPIGARLGHPLGQHTAEKAWSGANCELLLGKWIGKVARPVSSWTNGCNVHPAQAPKSSPERTHINFGWQ